MLKIPLGELRRVLHRGGAVTSLSLVIALVLGLAGQTRPWQALELKGFDLLTVLTAAGRSSLPITIIGIDEASFAEIAQQWPWPRTLHARLVDRLREEGAAVIAFDVLFSESAPAGEDRQLADAIQRAGNVVLASDLVYRENHLVRQWVRVDPVLQLRQAGARPGMAGLALDPDGTVRRIPEYRDAFWRQIVSVFNEVRPGLLGEVDVEAGTLLRYVGPDHTFPYVPYYQALGPRAFLPEGVFKDHIVLVGRDIGATPEAGAAQADMLFTPFTMQTRALTPGVEIHASILESALTRRAIRPLTGAGMLLLVLSVAAAAVLMRNWRPLPSAGVMLGLLAVLAALDAYLFEHSRWVPVGAAATGVVLMYLGLGAIGFLAERKQRQELKLAFSRYVAPQVMDVIIDHPERLVLGGERREITIMFTDLAGFTALSEQLSPEQVAQLLIRHLTAMTEIILRYGGTVDKFIGDAIMAFWGAPIADPQQGEHACRAAQEMLEAMRAIREELSARGLPALVMRVGMHSGEAVVGNMGSESRFDYTAVGDNVNLASRLEGVNKLYGTELLLSGATARRAGEAVHLRRVDKVRVQGKLQAVEIFTLAPAGARLELNEAAIEAYRNRDWDASERRWREWLDCVPGDGIARVYLERIERFRHEPPGRDWDGSITLDKM